jgi:hypothetical protein
MSFIDREFDGKGATVTAREFLAAVDEAAMTPTSSGDMMEQGMSERKVLEVFIRRVNDDRKTSSFSGRLLWVVDTEGRPTLVPGHVADTVKALNNLKRQFATAETLADTTIRELIEKSIA